MNETTTSVNKEEGIQGPSWFVELINRLKAVITKLLLKFGIKWGLV